MTRNQTHNMVIDASIARSAGDKNKAPLSTHCREFLETFMQTDKKIIMSKEIFREWKKHESGFSKKWRATMVAKKRMLKIDDVKFEAIRSRVEVFTNDEHIKKAVIKDLHLVEAALNSDKMIASCDNKMRRYLVELSFNCEYVHEIIWVDPSNENEEVIEWLYSGCRKDNFRKIGYLSSNEAASS